MTSSNGQEVAFFRQMAAAKSAKAAGLDADVGEIDVAVDHVGDDIADGARAQGIGSSDDGEKIRAVGVEKMGGLVDGDVMTGKSAI